MKIDKEYPATHSMDTSWFIADKDGSVALVVFDDNGPVPLDSRIEDVDHSMLLEEFATMDEEGYYSISLTDAQAETFLKAMEGEPFADYYYNVFCQIDNRFKEFFLRYAHENPNVICLNRQVGLYYLIDGNGEKLKPYHEKGLFLKKFDGNDEYAMVFKENVLEALPFYLIWQGSPWDGISNASELFPKPKAPFNISQFGPNVRDRVLTTSASFKEMEKFQMADQFENWETWGFAHDIEVNGNHYMRTERSDGSVVFYKVSYKDDKYIGCKDDFLTLDEMKTLGYKDDSK